MNKRWLGLAVETNIDECSDLSGNRGWFSC